MPAEASDVLERLETVGALELPAVQFVYSLLLEGEDPNMIAVAASQEYLRRAIDQLKAHHERTKRTVDRCCNLPAVPSRRLPPGF